MEKEKKELGNTYKWIKGLKVSPLKANAADLICRDMQEDFNL